MFGSDEELRRNANPQRDCITCLKPLSKERLKAMPDAVQCVQCVSLAGDEPRIRGRMVWSHKTAPEIEIGTALAAQPAQMSYGPSFRLDSKAKLGRAIEASSTLGWLPLQDGAIIGAKPAADDAPVEVVPIMRIKNPARCHPFREQIGPSGVCLECAIKQQEARMKVR
jgi:hypothetical protein